MLKQDWMIGAIIPSPQTASSQILAKMQQSLRKQPYEKRSKQ